MIRAKLEGARVLERGNRDSMDELGTTSHALAERRAKSGTRHVTVRALDATPCEGIGSIRLMADQAHGNDEVTQVQCPKCNGEGETEERAETATGYSIAWTECWLCKGCAFVSPTVRTQFKAWALKNAPGR